MKVLGRGSITIGNKTYKQGDTIPWSHVYPGLLLHMLIFGASGFYMAYFAEPDVIFLFMHGGVAITIYMLMYSVFFGIDEIKWMLINAGLGFFGIFTQIDWFLSLFGKRAAEFSFVLHIIPFLYFVMYTFLLRQAIVDLAHARENRWRKNVVEIAYVILSVILYAGSYWFLHR